MIADLGNGEWKKSNMNKVVPLIKEWKTSAMDFSTSHKIQAPTNPSKSKLFHQLSSQDSKN